MSLLTNLKNNRAWLYAFCFLVLFSCRKDYMRDNFNNAKENGGQTLKIAIVSDIHYMDRSLLRNHAESGAAFQAYLDQDPKLIQYSDPIFRQCMKQLVASKPDILLIPGDLTKDGEKVSHQSIIQLLRELKKSNIKIFVVPGNHDINNPEAAQYDGDNASPAPSITSNEFATLYAEFGYGTAIARDPQSLSYVNEIYPGIWILGLDACRYEDNQNIAIVGGRLKPETQSWAIQWINEARKRHVAIFGMMHHGIVEHYAGQNQLDPGYVIDDYENVVHNFTMAGLSVVFTGHYHANDITSRQDGNKILYDIETGSMVTAPIPYRLITIRGNSLDITTNYIRDIDAQFPGGLDFPTFANTFLSNHLDGYIGYALANPPYSLPNELVSIGAPLLRDGFMAHFAGDEKVSPEEQAKIDAFGQWVPPLGDALNSLWTDIPPADNLLHINIPSQ